MHLLDFEPTTSSSHSLLWGGEMPFELKVHWRLMCFHITIDLIGNAAKTVTHQGET